MRHSSGRSRSCPRGRRQMWGLCSKASLQVAGGNVQGGNGGPWLTILEPFRWARSSQGFHTLESSRCSDSNEEHRAPVVDLLLCALRKRRCRKAGPSAYLDLTVSGPSGSYV